MSLKLLKEAAKLAAKDLQSKKKYIFAAIAKRTDGAVVRSINHDCPDRHFDHHAEARVLRKTDKGGAVLYVARVLKDKKTSWARAKPCPRCQVLIKRMGVKAVYYTIGPNEYGCWFPGRNIDILLQK